jgi:hypothetical protein
MSDNSQRSVARDWRWLLMVIIFFYASLAFVIPVLKITSEKQLLQGFGVAALDYPMMDLRGVAVWCDAAKEGKNPTMVPTWIHLPGESHPHPNFLMNYSPQVLLLGKLGFSESTIVAWGLGLSVLYVVSLWILCGSCSFPRAMLWALLICSPASVLVVERGNLDLLLFALLLGALLLRKHPWVEALMILAVASLKFFPIASLCAPWKEERNGGRAATLAATLIFIIYLAALHSHLAAIMGSLSGQCQSAFGCTTIADLLAHNGILSGAWKERFYIILKIAAPIGLGGCFLAGCSMTRSRIYAKVLERSRHAFFLTAPMMIGLFVLGPQMDYKWIFFLFMVPAGLDLIHSSYLTEAIAAKAWFVSVALYSWWTFFSDEGSLRNALLKQVLMWIVMLLSAFLTGVLWNRRISKKCPQN